MIDLKEFRKGETEADDWLEKLSKFLHDNYWFEKLISGQLVPKGEKGTYGSSIVMDSPFPNGYIRIYTDSTRDSSTGVFISPTSANFQGYVSCYEATGTGAAYWTIVTDTSGGGYARMTGYPALGVNGNMQWWGDPSSSVMMFEIKPDGSMFFNAISAPSPTTDLLYNVSGAGLTWNGSLIERQVNKNAASGYAGLDSSSKLTGSQQVYGTAANTACQGNDARLGQTFTPDAITAAHTGTAASTTTANTEVTTDGDSDEDNVTLGAGTVGQVKNIYCKAVGNAADSYKITPATMVGGTKVSFAASPLGKGATFVYTSSGWVCIGTQGGVVS